MWKVTGCETPLTIYPVLPEYVKSDPLDRTEWDSRERQSYLLACRNGFSKRTLQVGCSKCFQCEAEKQERKKNIWFQRLLYGINAFQREGLRRWCMGEDVSMESGHVFFMTLTVANEDYPGAGHVINSEITALNKTESFREHSYQHFKRRLQLLWKQRRKAGDNFKYVVFIEFGNQSTCRIHAHVFVFVAGGYSEGNRVVTDMETTWRDRWQVEQTEISWVQTGDMAAVYATKYASKTIQEHRIASSQFDWENYLEFSYAKMYGIPVDYVDGITKSGYYKQVPQGGYTQWHVVKESVPITTVGLKGEKGLSEYLDGLSVLRDEDNNPYVIETFKPQVRFKGGFIKWLRQRPKVDSILNRILTGTQKLPAGCSLKMVASGLMMTLKATIHRITNLQLVRDSILAVLSGSLSVSALDPEALYRVSNQLRKYFRNESTAYTRLLRSTLVPGT